MADVLGFWIGHGAKQRLMWQIDGEIISDVGLQRWVRENMDYFAHAHDGIICARHTIAFALRHLKEQSDG